MVRNENSYINLTAIHMLHLFIYMVLFLIFLENFIHNLRYGKNNYKIFFINIKNKSFYISCN